MAAKTDNTLARKKRRPRKTASTDSIASEAEGRSRSPKDVLALGRAIVRQLEFSDCGAVLDRWLAHHVAELMVRADEASSPDKAAAEARVVDIILKLWANRRALPAQADPLGGYRRAITVLGALAPEANPWARHSGSGTEEALLRELFETMSRVVVGGILLTTAARSRALGAGRWALGAGRRYD